MGRFDGILLCSDWDGTLFTGEAVPRDTSEAIEYFKSEGGLFSLSSGRAPDYLKDMSRHLSPNTYCICYGGALVTDIFSGEVLKKDFINEDAFDIVDLFLSSKAHTKKINLMLEDYTILHLTPEEYSQFSRNLPYKIYKITLNGSTDEDGEIYARLAKEISDEKYTLARSYASYIELMKTKNTKGYAAKMLKNRLGARLLVGFGDYENDIPLFRETDISFAVANAVPALKELATATLTRTVGESAAAELINVLKGFTKPPFHLYKS